MITAQPSAGKWLHVLLRSRPFRGDFIDPLVFVHTIPPLGTGFSAVTHFAHTQIHAADKCDDRTGESHLDLVSAPYVYVGLNT